MITSNESHLYNVLFEPAMVFIKISFVLPFGLCIFKIMYGDC